MVDRRWALRAGLAITGASLAGTAGAAELEPTPSQPEGPFYPTTKPARLSADLTQGHGEKDARGERLALGGRVLARDGSPLAGVMVEIWQADYQGIYHHTGDDRHLDVDPGFAGYGEVKTGAAGEFALQTIVPAPYTGRPPHIHVRLVRDDTAVLTTQLYIKDHPANEKQGFFSSLIFSNTDKLLMQLQPGSASGKAAQFHLVV